jgi:hypothetical protein
VAQCFQFWKDVNASLNSLAALLLVIGSETGASVGVAVYT